MHSGSKPVNVKVKFQAEPCSLKRVDSENKVTSNKGFVSFREFTGPEEKDHPHQMKIKQLTSLEDFDNGSLKQ